MSRLAYSRPVSMLENHLNVIKLDIEEILYKTNYGLWSFQVGGTKSNIFYHKAR